MNAKVDISEDYIRDYDAAVLNTLLIDRTTGKNIFWATSDYEEHGEGFEYSSPILPKLITGKHIRVIRPRILKARELQSARARGMAEVFTPSWVCNAQNNLIDEAWFGRKNVFNIENEDNTWTTIEDKVEFPDGKTWKDYVKDTRLEITCGEAPYLTSRYDATTGEPIEVKNRIGIIDRKLRVVGENANSSKEYLEMAREAYKSTYAYEWQGDSLLLAREALLFTFIEHYQDNYGKEPQKNSIQSIANIISWNIFQMDGLKCVIPNSCNQFCKGCKYGTPHGHNGIPVIIYDWHTNIIIPFSSLLPQ